MILQLIVASALANAAPAAAPATSLADAAQALRAGRAEQARLMIGKAVAAGASGPEVNRLLADLAFTVGNYAEAVARYEQVLARTAGPELAERAAIAALKLGQVDRALPLLVRATGTPGASWRAWNARGVIADLQSDWAMADVAYGRAAELAPDQPELINNRGWSQLLRGNWQPARGLFARAAALQPGSDRIANNLELVEAVLREDLPVRRPGESTRDWARRLNDAGVAAQLTGNRAKAVAAFTQALEASESWYQRAANNLAALSPGQ